MHVKRHQVDDRCIEHELARVESEIRAKQVRSSLLQCYQHQCNEWISQQKAYQQMLTEIQQQDQARRTQDGDDDNGDDDGDSHTIQQLCQLLEHRLLYNNNDSDDNTNESIKKYLTSRTTHQALARLRDYLDTLPIEIPPPSSQPEQQERTHIQHERISLDQLVEIQQKETELEQRVRDLSHQVRVRVNHFYPDSNIQEALW